MWEDTFKKRMNEFGRRAPDNVKGEPFSIKIRVAGGCFHREHSPEAYRIIDGYLSGISEPESYFSFEEHESGPEILVYLALTTAGLSLAKSIIDLIVAVIKARSEGIKKGDSPCAPLELIVRRIQRGDEFVEEKVMRINSFDRIDENEVKKQVDRAFKNLADKEKRISAHDKKRKD
ncbi:MAG: hypothetical protein WC436_05850 [Candidatus Babeliales bacterium]